MPLLNYLFAESDAEGERTAAIYSLIGTAKMHGLNPQAYLAHVLERIADHPRLCSSVDQKNDWRVY